jgi:hypothetical protein
MKENSVKTGKLNAAKRTGDGGHHPFSARRVNDCAVWLKKGTGV